MLFSIFHFVEIYTQQNRKEMKITLIFMSNFLLYFLMWIVIAVCWGIGKIPLIFRLKMFRCHIVLEIENLLKNLQIHYLGRFNFSLIARRQCKMKIKIHFQIVLGNRFWTMHVSICGNSFWNAVTSIKLLVGGNFEDFLDC